ncbi:GNAT family N-acetyltransferase [Aureibacillus halotolerans]
MGHIFYKELYFYPGNTPTFGTIRTYTPPDFEGLIRLQEECFPPPFPSELHWDVEQLQNHVTLFPDGALCAEVDGKLVGSITSLIVREEDYAEHTWATITDDGMIRNHNPQGDALYVVDLCVSPEFRGQGIGSKLMSSLYEVTTAYRLKKLFGGVRMPGYAKVADQLTPHEYLEDILSGKRTDPIVTMLMKSGRRPIKLLPDYIDDDQSKGYAVLMEWANPILSESNIP